MGGGAAQQGGQTGGADPQSVLESLFDVIEAAEEGEDVTDLFATLMAMTDCGTKQSIFASVCLQMQTGADRRPFVSNVSM